MKSAKINAFTLTEVVIVILILGVVAALAGPRLLSSGDRSGERGTRHQLQVLRQAIATYQARSGSYPEASRLPEALAEMLDRPLPAPLVGPHAGEATVYYDLNQDPELPVEPNSEEPAGWAYKPINGSLRLNVPRGDTGSEW